MGGWVAGPGTCAVGASDHAPSSLSDRAAATAADVFSTAVVFGLDRPEEGGVAVKPDCIYSNRLHSLSVTFRTSASYNFVHRSLRSSSSISGLAANLLCMAARKTAIVTPPYFSSGVFVAGRDWHVAVELHKPTCWDDPGTG